MPADFTPRSIEMLRGNNVRPIEMAITALTNISLDIIIRARYGITYPNSNRRSPFPDFALLQKKNFCREMTVLILQNVKKLFKFY